MVISAVLWLVVLSVCCWGWAKTVLRGAGGGAGLILHQGTAGLAPDSTWTSPEACSRRHPRPAPTRVSQGHKCPAQSWERDLVRTGFFQTGSRAGGSPKCPGPTPGSPFGKGAAARWAPATGLLRRSSSGLPSPRALRSGWRTASAKAAAPARPSPPRAVARVSPDTPRGPSPPLAPAPARGQASRARTCRPASSQKRVHFHSWIP